MSIGIRDFEWKLMIAVTAATGVGYLGANMMPMWLGPVMDGMSIGPERAGRLGSAELLAGMLGSLAVAPLIGRLPRRRLALVACAFVAAGYALSATIDSYLTLALTRAATGFCCGVVLAAGNAAAAGARDPDRVFAAMGFFGGLAASGILLSLGYVTGSHGYAGIFALLTLVVIVSLLPLAWMPERGEVPSLAELPGEQPGEAIYSTLATPTLAPLATLGGLLLLSISGQGMWAFTERIGIGIGLESERIGLWISLATLAGLPSAALAAVIGTRFGRMIPLAIAIVVSSGSQWILASATSESVYVISQITWALGFFLWTPVVLGTAAALDRGGRWTVAAGAITMFGVAVGPWSAGQLLEYFPASGLATLVVGCAIGGLTLLLPVTFTLDRQASPAVSDPR